MSGAPAPLRVLLVAEPADAAPDASRADALVLSSPPPAPPGWLASLRGGAGAPALYVRVAPGMADLDAALALVPDGIVLPVASDAAAVARLGVRLSVHEAEAGRPDGAVRILAGLASARALLRFAGPAETSPRLAGLFCAVSDLARDLGLAASPREPWPAPLVQARGLVVLAAAALGVPAFDGPDPAAGPEATRRAARAARRDGFRGGFAASAGAAAILAAVFRSGSNDPAVPPGRGGPIRDPG